MSSVSKLNRYKPKLRRFFFLQSARYQLISFFSEVCFKKKAYDVEYMQNTQVLQKNEVETNMMIWREKKQICVYDHAQKY